MKSAPPHHPVLQKFNLVATVAVAAPYDDNRTTTPTGGGGNNNGCGAGTAAVPSEADISSTDVLSYLLETDVLNENTLQTALDGIISERQRRRQRQAELPPAVGTSSLPGGVGAEPSATVDGDDEGRTTTTTAGGGAVGCGDSATATTNRTRHVALRLCYDGAGFSGLAENAGQDGDNSIEGALFAALLKARLVTSRECSGYSRCGRTDRGVSASCQVVALHLKSAIPMDALLAAAKGGTTTTTTAPPPVETQHLPKNEFESISVWTFPRSSKGKTPNTESTRVCREMKEYPYATILNNLLPPAIRVLGWTPVSTEFSARFSAATRTYRYFFCICRRMDLPAIRDGLTRLVGKHDFRNFCKMDVEKVSNFERVIHAARLVVVVEPPPSDDSSGGGGGVAYLEILGQAFLWHQIRCIAEVLFMVGNGYEPPSVVSSLLDVSNLPRKPSYGMADELPLVLHDCGYPNLRFGHSVRNLWTVACQLEGRWTELTLAAARLRNCLRTFEDMPVLKDDLAGFVRSKLEERIRKRKRRRDRSNNNHDNNNNRDDGGEDGVPPTLADMEASLLPDPETGASTSTTITWGQALPWMSKWGLVPDSLDKLHTAVHVPLLERSGGTTYEEKVEALLQKSSDNNKRRRKYTENVVKKQKTASEDDAFYSHMMKQGGTGI